jgi:hypothetical protein
MSLFKLALFSLLSIVSSNCVCSSSNDTLPIIIPQNNCISFSVGQGTGCGWMCSYCANTLGTNNYYFTDGVCTYQDGQGCVGSPIAGKTYSCCSV